MFETIPELSEHDGFERSRTEGHLIEELRREAYEVRDCFTRHSFQALAAAGALILLILKFQTDRHDNNADSTWELGVGALIPAIILFAIAQMGLHKYGTSNRLLGYELYLNRVRNYSAVENFHPLMLNIGWEEAMRAWRVIHYSIYREIYRNTYWTRAVYSFWRVKPTAKLPEWCDPRTLAKKGGAHYYSGSYLRNLMTSIVILIAIALLDFAGSTWYWCAKQSPQIAWTVSVICAVFLILCIGRISHIWSRMHILEDELLSIHSASIVWEIVVLAHFLALHKVGLLAADRTTAGNLRGYTQSVAEISVEAIKMKDDIYTKLSTMRKEVFDVMALKRPNTGVGPTRPPMVSLLLRIYTY
jgi:hypothetical protein